VLFDSMSCVVGTRWLDFDCSMPDKARQEADGGGGRL